MCTNDSPEGLPPLALRCLPAAEHPDLATYPRLVYEARKRYSDRGMDYQRNLQDYSTYGDYLNWGDTVHFRESDIFRLRPDGIPEVLYEGEYYLNPVTIAQYALAEHGSFVDGDGDSESFLAAVDLLLELQQPDGGLPNTFPWQHYRNGASFTPPWYSSLAQGQALSAFARAYDVTGDERYLEAGNRALGFLVQPLDAGGLRGSLVDLDPDLAGYVTFEEYPTSPQNYTFNGFLFALLGLHDWATVSAAAGDADTAVEAAEWLDRGMETLRVVLPYQDAGGFTAYDLGHYTMEGDPSLQAEYHAIHIYLLHAIASITGDERVACFETFWRSYVDESPS